MEAVWSAWCRKALSVLGCGDVENGAQLQLRNAKRLVVFYDLSHQIVQRQLEFRRAREFERDTSYSSLSSLATVSEELVLLTADRASTPLTSALTAEDWLTAALASPGPCNATMNSGDNHMIKIRRPPRAGGVHSPSSPWAGLAAAAV